jgi:hypothetical protein
LRESKVPPRRRAAILFRLVVGHEQRELERLRQPDELALGGGRERLRDVSQARLREARDEGLSDFDAQQGVNPGRQSVISGWPDNPCGFFFRVVCPSLIAVESDVVDRRDSVSMEAGVLELVDRIHMNVTCASNLLCITTIT